MNTKRLGDTGELLAVEYLKKNGFKILDRNFIYRMPGAPQAAEIDIVAKKDKIISFVEVKTSAGDKNSNWSPEEKVNFQKRRKMMRAAELWMVKHKIPLETAMQLDVIAITYDSLASGARIQHSPDVS